MPTQVEQPNQGDLRTETVTADPGSEDEAIAAFNQRRQSQATTEHEDAPADETDDGADHSEPDEGDPEADADPSDELVEVQFEGETFEVPPKLKDALLRKADYSRSMNALAETKKDYAQRIESIERREAGAEKLAKAMARVETIDAQLEQFKAIDWDKLEAEDPGRASILGLKAMRLQNARVNALEAAKAVDSELVLERQKDVAAKQAAMVKVLEKDFPGGWGNDAGKRVTEYAIKAGFSPDELRQLTDPRTVLLLEKARKFDAIQDGKREAMAKAKEAPALARPGAPRRSNPVADVQARFHKTNSPEDAVALLEARAQTRRR